MNTKVMLASTILGTLILATAAQAGGRAANNYDNAQAAQSVEIVKVSLQQTVVDYGRNR